MDNLARNAMLAKQAGMSYGKWKAMQQPVQIHKPQDLQPGWGRCAECGKPFKKYNKKQQYCEVGCQKQAYDRKNKERKAEYMKKWREQKMATE